MALFFLPSGSGSGIPGAGRDGHCRGFGDGFRTGYARSTTFLGGRILNEVHKNLLMAGMEINFWGQSRFAWGLKQQVSMPVERSGAMRSSSAGLGRDKDWFRGLEEDCLKMKFPGVGIGHLGVGHCWVAKCWLSCHVYSFYLSLVTVAWAFDNVHGSELCLELPVIL